MEHKDWRDTVTNLRAEVESLKQSVRMTLGVCEKLDKEKDALLLQNNALRTSLECIAKILDEQKGDPLAMGMAGIAHNGLNNATPALKPVGEKINPTTGKSLCQALREQDGLHCWADRPCPVHDVEKRKCEECGGSGEIGLADGEISCPKCRPEDYKSLFKCLTPIHPYGEPCGADLPCKYHGNVKAD